MVYCYLTGKQRFLFETNTFYDYSDEQIGAES